MGALSLAELQSRAGLLVAGCRNNSEAMAARGHSSEATNALETSSNRIQTLNSEQETLKAQEKAKTSELNAEITRLKEMYSEAVKTVKLAIPQDRWGEFGILAKR